MWFCTYKNYLGSEHPFYGFWKEEFCIRTLFFLHTNSYTLTHTYSYRYKRMTLSVSIRLISAGMEGGRAGVILASNQNLSMQQRENPKVKLQPWGREKYTERGGERESATDRECGDTLVCISSYTTSRERGTNTFFLKHLKFRLSQCRKHFYKIKTQASVLILCLSRVYSCVRYPRAFHLTRVNVGLLLTAANERTRWKKPYQKGKTIYRPILGTHQAPPPLASI